jgi:7,8-dihydropterin-6-yl-methyl-4-(beta-D-ribofuranosyl)aminobenzene 5'-phosphate synthase
MSKALDVGAVDRASITVLVDNKADLMVESADHVTYFKDAPLLAEHGFSALIQLDDMEDLILWDAGVSRVALLENMRRMKSDVGSIRKIALSHGHLDHYAAMTDVLSKMDIWPEDKEWGEIVSADEIETWVEGFRVPIIMHPAALRERWWINDSGNLVGPFFPPPALEWEALGAKPVLEEESTCLEPGCWTTGYIPRESFEKAGRSDKLRYRDGSDFIPDDLEDDQAIVIHVQDKGLVVLSGCAHSGIVNTIEYAKRLMNIDAIHAVIGGFHLGRADDEEIDQTIDYFKDVNPRYICPSHCTGFRAQRRFAQEFPDQFIEGVVGATYLF